MSRTAIIAAMPGELKPLVRGWKPESINGVHLWRWQFDGGEWIAACAGAGADAATRAFAEVEKPGRVDQVISVGWAGAVDPSCEVGCVYRVSGVIDTRTGERMPTSSSHEECWLATSPKVADIEEKRRLANAYRVALVDMEAAVIGRLAGMRGIPFYAVKGVSDGTADDLPDFNRFLSPQGEFRLSRLILFAILHPRYWPALIRMGENSKRAAEGIAATLLDFLDERGHIRKRNGYPNFKC